jgi:hypothetical protein
MITIKLDKSEYTGPTIMLDEFTPQELQFMKPTLVGKNWEKGTHRYLYIDGPAPKITKEEVITRWAERERRSGLDLMGAAASVYRRPTTTVDSGTQIYISKKNPGE